MASPALPNGQREEIESFVTNWVTDNRIPGAAVAVTDSDDVIYAEGFGARTLEENEPVTPRTLFGMGSCTKTFTAAAIMQLVEAGDLDVRDPVNAYLPHLSAAPGDPITVRNLLSHTSGMPAHASSPLWPKPNGLTHIGVPLSSRDDFRRHVQGAVDRRVTDRETFFYYNAGYTMLGLLIEEITDQPVADYIEDHILTPLGMDRSTFSKEEFDAEADRSTPYIASDDGPTVSEFPFEELLHGPGGLISSVEEMATWVRALMNGGAYGDQSVLDETSVKEMTTPVSTMYTTFEGGRLEYGYGVMIKELLNDRLVGHGGSIGVSNAYYGYLDNANLGIAIVCSTRPEAHIMSVGAAVLALIQGESPESVVPHYKLISSLERASGSYVGYPDLADITVERDGGLLRLTADRGSGSSETVMIPDRSTDERLVCRTTDVDGFEHEVHFEFDDDGADLYFRRNRYQKVP